MVLITTKVKLKLKMAKISDMDLVNVLGRMDLSMKVNGRMESSMAKENSQKRMEQLIKPSSTEESLTKKSILIIKIILKEQKQFVFDLALIFHNINGIHFAVHIFTSRIYFFRFKIFI
jgi:hypothetical protein